MDLEDCGFVRRHHKWVWVWQEVGDGRWEVAASNQHESLTPKASSAMISEAFPGNRNKIQTIK